MIYRTLLLARLWMRQTIARWNTGADGERRIYWHAQNLNEDRDGKPKGSMFRYGRGWLHIQPVRTTLGLEWVLPSRRFHVGFDVSSDGDDTLRVTFAVPPMSLHVGLESWPLSRRLYELAGRHGYRRELSLRIFDWAIWWTLWRDSHEWHSGDRRQGAWHPFGHPGSRVGETEIRETRDVMVPMPEGLYAAKATRSVATCRSTVFPLLRQRFERVEFDFGRVPIPVPGKGENSWDCGEDGIFGMGTGAKSIEEAIGIVVADALRTRRQRGGKNWRPEAHAKEQAP